MEEKSKKDGYEKLFRILVKITFISLVISTATTVVMLLDWYNVIKITKIGYTILIPIWFVPFGITVATTVVSLALATFLP